jgi:glycosyltransferase involved in cell wall biosynthesis
MSSNLVSVVIPAYNAELFIERAINSVLEQNYQPVEIIVIDDGSQDKTVELVKSFESKNVIKCLQQENGGPSKARNAGILEAKGQYIAFLDADDVWVNQDKLKLQIEAFNSEENLVLVDTFAEIFWDKSSTAHEMRDNSKTTPQDFLYQNCINATSSVLVKRQSLISVGLFDEEISFGEDRLLWAQVSMIGKLKTIREMCVWKENHSMNLTSKYFFLLNHRIEMLEKLFNLIPFDRNDKESIILQNFKEAFQKAWFFKDIESYKKAYTLIKPHVKLSLIFSRYTLIYPLLVFISFYKKHQK